LTFFKNFGENNKRRILILGEYHSNKKLYHQDQDQQCFDLHMWLYKLSKIAPECIDVYLEMNEYKQNNTKAIEKKSTQKLISEYAYPISSIDHMLTSCKKRFHVYVII